MRFREQLVLFGVSLMTFFGLDLVWLGVVASDFYAAQLGELLRPDVQWFAAILFYLLFVVGIVFFVTIPAVRAGSWRRAAATGALFGVVTYAAFDLTCLALFRDFPVLVVVVDLVWGGVLTGSVAVVGCLFAIRRKNRPVS